MQEIRSKKPVQAAQAVQQNKKKDFSIEKACASCASCAGKKILLEN